MKYVFLYNILKHSRNILKILLVVISLFRYFPSYYAHY